MNKNKIKIIGLDASTREISAEKRSLIYSSDVLAGGKRHLDLFVDFKSTKIPITHDIPGLINDIKQHLEKGLTISVLASGDPLLFGIGNRLIKEFGIDSIEIYPGISAVQTALSKLGLKTDNTLVINRHASRKESLEKICYHNVSVIFTSGSHTPADVINELTDRYPWSCGWRGHICECIGMGDEKISSGNL
ncbi:MAG: precorrin-6y C5,15-methyltransferase (decarboxylating) subunit CbiE, partial [Desulfobacteraceae bacterium]